MPENPKIVGLSDAAFRLYIEALCWCSRQEEDGIIPEAAIKRLGKARSITELVTAGLLIDAGSEYMVHDYLRHQRSRAEITAFRQSRQSVASLERTRGGTLPPARSRKTAPTAPERRWRQMHSSSHSSSHSCCHARANGKPVASDGITRPIPILILKSSLYYPWYEVLSVRGTSSVKRHLRNARDCHGLTIGPEPNA